MLHRADWKAGLVALCLLASCQAAAWAQDGQGTIRPAVANDAPLEMRLIPDDTLLLRVIGEEDLSGAYIVRDDGVILLPIVDEVHVGGLTLMEATRVLREALAVPIINPQISLELTKPAARRIYVAGEVLKPGVLEWRDAPSLSKALNLAAGITERGDVRNVRVKRGAVERTLDVSRLVREGDYSVDVALEPGDQVLVPERPRVTILGPVPGAGVAYFEEGDTLYQLLSEKQITRSQVATGGRTDISPAELRYVRVMRGDETIIVNLETIRRTGDPSSDLPLARDDRIVIADRGEVFVAGRVSRPGPIDTRQGYTAARAISAAGGALQDAALDRCVVIHDGQASEVDLAATLSDGRPEGDVEVSSGDLVVVPNNQVMVLGGISRPGTYGLRWRCRLSDALAAAGGPLLNSDLRRVTIMRDHQPIVVDVTGLLEEGTAGDDPSLSPNDVVIVPEAWVYVLGEAAKPGPVPYRQAHTLRQVLSAAGGVTANARIDSGYVVRGLSAERVDIAGALRTGSVEPDIELEPGDRIVIPELLDQRVYVTGQVMAARALRIEEAPDLSKAIALAGGVTAATADLSSVRVIRDGSVLPVNLHALYYDNDLTQNIALQAGDTVVVPSNETGYVYVLGTVNRPGSVRHFEGMRLSQALSEAGGYPQDARITEVVLAREVGGERKVYTVPFSDLFSPTEPESVVGPPTEALGHVPAEYQESTSVQPADPSELEPDPLVLRGDVIYVPERSGARARRTILPWLGEVGYWLGRLLGLR